uniref:Putative cytochrome P450 n=1 Tax=Eschscholzia californica subsp. californica TaxID=222997 RepID=A0A2Z6BXT8_ESCCA|nr:putative cytochrome P450 [Eschscholzia californica subsp. californica]
MFYQTTTMASNLSTNLILSSIFTAFLLYFLLKMRPFRSSKNKSRKQAPKPTGSWPVIGHLLQLQGPNLPHINLAALADKYGPVFNFQIGLRPAIVVSSWEIAKECLGTNDRVFVSRPPLVAMKHMGYGHALSGFSPYGPYWRELRKLVNQELLSSTRIELIKHVWDTEINTFINDLYEVWVMKSNEGGGDVVVEMKQCLYDFTLNLTLKILTGKRYFGGGSGGGGEELREEAGRCQKAVRNFLRLVGTFTAQDVIPFLEGWLDLGGHEKEMKITGKELDSLLQKWLEEHKVRKSTVGEEGQEKGYDDEQDFMGVMLTKLRDHEKLLRYYDADTINKATCLTVILGGSDTTMMTLVWALALLVNHPHVMKKLQDELDTHVSKERQVEESDIKNLVYLQSVMKETMRRYPGTPLYVRESIEDCTIAGYDVPTGTRLVVNAWKIQHDPQVWSNPFEFNPERFLTTHKDIDVRGQNFELIPFGAGRRMCPGASLGLQVVHLTLARLVHGFEFKTPDGEPMDMTESIGLTNLKATPLEIMLTPRLSSKLYVC